MASFAENYSTLVWEGYARNALYYGEDIKVRITLEGVIGRQLPYGRVEMYDLTVKEEYGGQLHQIFPMVEGGKITVERLTLDKEIGYQDTQFTLGSCSSKQLVHPWDSDTTYVLDVDTYFTPDYVFDTPDFSFCPSPEEGIISSTLKSQTGETTFLGHLYFPLSNLDFRGQHKVQAFSSAQAKKMMAEIEKGHKTLTLGSVLEDPQALSQPKSTHLTVEKALISPEMIEDKYGLVVKTEEGFWPVENLMQMTDTIYEHFPKGLIQEMTAYYKKKGRNVVLNFKYVETNLGGSFSDQGTHIYLNFYPNPIGDKFGEWTIAHETGHLVHKYINDRYGYNKFKDGWLVFNQGIPYQSNWLGALKEGYEEIFVRDYSMQNYSEDVATLFELLAGSNPYDIRNKMMETADFPLGNKIDYLTEILIEVSDAVTSDNNWQRVYPETPTPIYAGVINQASAKGLIIDDPVFAGLYTSYISRFDFAVFVNNYIEKRFNKSTSDLAEEKGLKVDWYHESSFAGGGDYKLNTNHPFIDVWGDWIFDMYSLGIAESDTVGSFNPENHITRQQVAKMIYQTILVTENLSPAESEDTGMIKDISELNQTSVTAINQLVDMGIMYLDEGGNFRPLDKISYEECYALLYRLYQHK